MYLDVISPPSPVPAVRGLSGRRGMGQVRYIPIPRLIRGRGFGGLGQSAGCQQGGFDAYMQQWVEALASEPATDAAVGCGNGGQPCGSPQEASQMAYTIAASWCQTNQNNIIFNCPADPNCADNGQSEAAPYAAQALSIFEGYPSSVWSAEAAAGQSGEYYNEVPTCPPDTSPSVQNGVTICYSTVTGAVEQPTYAPAPVSGSPQGPSVVVPTTPPAPATGSAAAPTTATITNASRPGQSFEVGDQYQLVITGPPNTQVTGSASQNGGPASSSGFGPTNSSGKLTILGTFGASDAGSWSEQWQAGSAPASQISFSVSAAASGSGGSSGSGGASSNTGGSSNTSTSTGLDLSFLTNNVGIAGQEIPVWALIGGALLVFMMVKK